MQNETSAEGPGEQTIDSVFDFLYHDGRRVASFLAQFDPSGSLTQISEGRNVEKVRVDVQRLEGSASAAGFAKGLMASTDEVRSRRQDDIMRVYDPMWSNARALLDLLDQKQMIQRELGEAKLGQMVLLSGSLSIYDLKVMSGIWQMKSVRALMLAGLPKPLKLPKAQEHTAAGKLLKDQHAQLVKLGKDQLDLFTELAPALPHSAHGIIVGEDQRQMWFNIDPLGLSAPTSEIMLKHGVGVPGRWTVLGILDALPEPMEVRTRKQSPDGAEAIAKLFEAIAPIVRTMFGRPEEAYGLTPLLIFREAVLPTD